MSMQTKNSCVVRQVENGYVLVAAKWEQLTHNNGTEVVNYPNLTLVETETFYPDMTNLLPAVNAVFSA